MPEPRCHRSRPSPAQLLADEQAAEVGRDRAAVETGVLNGRHAVGDQTDGHFFDHPGAESLRAGQKDALAAEPVPEIKVHLLRGTAQPHRRKEVGHAGHLQLRQGRPALLQQRPLLSIDPVIGLKIFFPHGNVKMGKQLSQGVLFACVKIKQRAVRVGQQQLVSHLPSSFPFAALSVYEDKHPLMRFLPPTGKERALRKHILSASGPPGTPAPRGSPHL